MTDLMGDLERSLRPVKARHLLDSIKDALSELHDDGYDFTYDDGFITVTDNSDNTTAGFVEIPGVWQNNNT